MKRTDVSKGRQINDCKRSQIYRNIFGERSGWLTDTPNKRLYVTTYLLPDNYTAGQFRSQPDNPKYSRIINRLPNRMDVHQSLQIYRQLS